MAFVKTEVQGAVEIITIDRPKALNALNPEVLADLKAAFEAVDQENVRCIVLTGEGDKSFVAGADIGSMSTMTKAEGEAFGKLGNDVFLMIESFPIPVIAAVNGFALGGGNELAMSCDIMSVRNGDQAAVGDDIVIALGVAGTARDLLFALDRQHVRGDRLAIKVFLPLVGQHAASRAHCRFDQSHNFTLLFLLLYLISAFAFDRIL